MVHAYNPSSWEAKFQDRLGYLAEPCLKKKKTC
jgi:hypothetical protein